MKFCPECGANVEGLKFCGECGQTLIDAPTQVPAKAPTNPKIIIAIIGVVVIGLGGIALTRNSDVTETSPTNQVSEKAENYYEIIENNGFSIQNGVLLKYYGTDTVVTIPNSVTSIGDGAFNGCYSLTSITIPDSVTIIGYEAFNKCTSLTK